MKSLRRPRIRPVGPDHRDRGDRPRVPPAAGAPAPGPRQKSSRGANSSLVADPARAPGPSRSTRPSRSLSVMVNGVCLRRGTARVSAHDVLVERGQHATGAGGVARDPAEYLAAELDAEPGSDRTGRCRPRARPPARRAAPSRVAAGGARCSTGRAASRTGTRSAASRPSSNIAQAEPVTAAGGALQQAARPTSADSIRQAVLLATPSSRASWVAPSSRWAAKQSSTETAIETDRRPCASSEAGRFRWSGRCEWG